MADGNADAGNQPSRARWLLEPIGAGDVRLQIAVESLDHVLANRAQLERLASQIEPDFARPRVEMNCPIVDISMCEILMRQGRLSREGVAIQRLG